MLKQEKLAWVEKHKGKFSNTKFAFVFRCQKVASEEMNEIRAAVKGSGCSIAVVKNTLAKIAVAGTDCASLDPLFKGTSILVTSESNNEDSYPAAVKALAPFLKTHKNNMSLAGGVVNGSFMDAKALDEFGKMPSRMDLIATISWYLQYPLINIADTIQRAGESR